MQYANDIVLITGAGSGMGKLAAERAAKAGRRVVGFDLNAAALQALEQQYENVSTYVVDITNYASVEESVQHITTNIGPIKRLINCAGIMPLGTLDSQHALEIKKIMDVNYLGTVNVNKAVIANMQTNGQGEIINFASIAGWSPTIAFGAYNAAKFAVVAFSEVLHHENKHTGIKVCCVCPPPVNTPLLRNAINRPKSLDITAAVEPAFVLDSMEKCIKKGKWLCTPGWQTKVAYFARRFVPNLTWKLIHLVEGRDLTHLSIPANNAMKDDKNIAAINGKQVKKTG
ncbi:MAG: SDR family NAD(P)-dependent oxidoreductase [Spongiibacteraceae bacterium]